MSPVSEQQVLMAAKLYRCRASARYLLGPRFQKVMAEHGTLIQSVAKAKGMTNLSAAMEMAEGLRAEQVLLLFAAVVELAEPSCRPETACTHSSQEVS